MEDVIKEKIDELIYNLGSLFSELLSAKTLYDIGRVNIDSISNDICISPIVGPDLQIEPIHISVVKKYKEKYPHFIFEVYHGKVVQLLNNLLDDIFEQLVKFHFSGQRVFSELKKQDVKIDFATDTDHNIQIKDNLQKDYSFKDFTERVRIINKVLNPSNNGNTELDNVKMNVILRNTVQHRNNILDEYIFSKLGRSEIHLQNDQGEKVSYKKGDQISISIPDIHLFIRSLLLIIQIWRKGNEQLFTGSGF
ncbi:hypothetical protein [Pseudobacteroides cellulosolvens]|uniref:Uncharacterized protein n=1 Tax=Pseudobacteroides cellulosolvens ATCC 35603 = DSM 2933 TaxID=398512 RepID=A0A0L6JGJ4_9FIRM|nr:hypothetical protein [Pseudobacteroides cellulosolvens]KNY24833.1 hypothetical protein Bccel_0090 [Pseudobacteroides cellulosolvens ATCC 35603 = DSM 2933]